MRILGKPERNTQPMISNSKGICTIHLPNGLTILLKEIHTAPLISQWVWYRVGSRNETPGITGISHFVEHIQFKGTPQYPAKIIDHAISRDGGVMNGITYLDWTTYYETMPADKIDLSLKMEADRMVNSNFNIDEIESERTVIISEREGNENEPLFRLSEAVQNASFSTHPYHYEVIGTLEDLHNISRDDLFKHYQTFYSPSNAIIAIAGDFEPDQIEIYLRNLYEKIPSTTKPCQEITLDTPLQSEKRIVVEGPGKTTYLEISYRAPRAAEKDFFIMTVLDSILTGPTSLNMFGGGISNKTSRLYQKLVEKDLAVSVSGGLTATIDPYLFDLSVTIHPDKKVDEVITSIDEEIDKLMENKVDDDEIRRAIKQAKALFAYGSENITNQAFWIGYANMFANYQWFENYIESLQTVTAEEVLQAARMYLSPDRRVVGIYQPGKEDK
jgi:zinc protease